MILVNVCMPVGSDVTHQRVSHDLGLGFPNLRAFSLHGGLANSVKCEEKTHFPQIAWVQKRV